MDKHVFEDALEQQMKSFTMEPSDRVWQSVEDRVHNRFSFRFLWWFLPVLFCSIGIFWFVFHSSKEHHTLSLTPSDRPHTTIEEPIQQNHSSPSANDYAERKTSILEAVDQPQTLKPGTEHLQRKTDQDTTPTEYLTKKTFASKRDRKHERYLAKHTCPIEYAFSASDTAASHLNIAQMTNDDVSSTVTIDQTSPNLLDTIVVVRDVDRSVTEKKQPPRMDKPNELSFSAFYSFHGSGDLPGTLLEFGVDRFIRKRISFYNNLGVTIHSGKETVYRPNAPIPLNTITHGLQSVTVGVQTTPTLYVYSKKERSRLGFSLLARYQHATNNGLSVYYVNPNRPQFSIRNDNPTTFSIGYKISYTFPIYSGFRTNLNAAFFFQNDTRGDAISGFGLSYRVKYVKK